MLYGIYQGDKASGIWVTPQPGGALRDAHTSLLEIFTTANQGHALAQLSVWKRCRWLNPDNGALHVAVIGKNGEPTRFVGEEKEEEG